MKLYIVRAFKYFLSLIILLGAIFAFMFLSGTSADASFNETFLSSKGLLLLFLLIVLSATYPYFGYTQRLVKHSFDREKVIKVFEACGYKLASEDKDAMCFRADSAIKKIKTMGEDAITLSQDGETFWLKGLRKEVVRIEYRLITFLDNNEN